MLNLFLGTNQAFDFTFSSRVFLADMDGHLDCSHIPLRHPIKAVDIMQKVFLYLLDGSCMQ